MVNMNPFAAMTNLSKKYGDIYRLQLGTVKTVVVSSMRLIRKVLIEQGADFGDRPNFMRYNILFSNDRGNCTLSVSHHCFISPFVVLQHNQQQKTLAFCDWSRVQKTRRALARRFCHTGIYGDKITTAIGRSEVQLLKTLQQDMETFGCAEKRLKLNIQKACASIFFDFFCSEIIEDWESDQDFLQAVQKFDEIFWEINQSHPTDVLPGLAPLFRSHLNQVAGMGKSIRDLVVRRIIEPHMERLDKDNLEDFVDILLAHLEEAEPESMLTMDQVLFELEDFLGGHSAVSNLVGRAIVEIATVPGLSKTIYEQHFEMGNKDYILAVIYETLRKTSSPIVPHVASADAYLDGYLIEKGTMVIINNYELNTSPGCWNEPHLFIPERFLTESGKFCKPSHFIPFSNGRRACMGYQLVEKVTADLILGIIKNFDITPTCNPNILPQSCVAIHPE
ncbi:Cytochrome P450 [Orchesella cincta]|uniref:Cytochrome P450 n=1 Tax=Orchesella cincta TaxID=48709 RepID=A0A1D2NHD9_ORCCI|nr:Cytochrome P450 [Orchesella cincta]